MFRKSKTPLDVKELPRYLDSELLKIEDDSKNPEVESIQVTVTNSSPDKPRQGQMYYADGANWDPGSGEGIYFYNASSTWVKL